MREFAYIDWVRQQLGHNTAAGVVIPPGDDCGALDGPTDVNAAPEAVLVTTDLIAEGTDFILGQATPQQIGRKALAVSLSDVAAMAALPMGAVIAVLVPDDADETLLKGLYEGLASLAQAFDCPLIGGDTNAWPGQLVLCSTVLARPGGVPPVRRGGAKPGDLIAVTGALGGSLAGHHLSFTPRVREARTLAGTLTLNAMLDLSDGLAGDLRHICRDSRVGAMINQAAVPVAAAAVQRAAHTGQPPWYHALTDGEDFELLFTFPAEQRAQAPSALRDYNVPVTIIGKVTADPALWMRTPEGGVAPLPAGGFEHLAPSQPRYVEAPRP